jgi:hypothetical protein
MKDRYTCINSINFENVRQFISEKAAFQMVRRGSDVSASACCKAGPSSILGSAPQEVFSTELTSDDEMERGPGEWRRQMYSMNVIG